MMICGLETAGKVTVRVTVLKKKEAGCIKKALPLLNADDMLMSLEGNLVICQIVNPLKTVRCEFPMKILECYGVKLP